MENITKKLIKIKKFNLAKFYSNKLLVLTENIGENIMDRKNVNFVVTPHGIE